MKQVFADSLYWIALAHQRAQWHGAALRASRTRMTSETGFPSEIRTAQKIVVHRSSGSGFVNFHGFGCRQNGGMSADTEFLCGLGNPRRTLKSGSTWNREFDNVPNPGGIKYGVHRTLVGGGTNLWGRN